MYDLFLYIYVLYISIYVIYKEIHQAVRMKVRKDNIGRIKLKVDDMF